MAHPSLQNVISDPEIGPTVHPRVIDVDLRDLPIRQPWRPGDAIREVPRRTTGLPGSYQKPEPQRDPLLDLQENAETNQNRAFNPPNLNFEG